MISSNETSTHYTFPNILQQTHVLLDTRSSVKRINVKTSCITEYAIVVLHVKTNHTRYYQMIFIASLMILFLNIYLLTLFNVVLSQNVHILQLNIFSSFIAWVSNISLPRLFPRPVHHSFILMKYVVFRNIQTNILVNYQFLYFYHFILCS